MLSVSAEFLTRGGQMPGAIPDIKVGAIVGGVDGDGALGNHARKSRSAQSTERLESDESFHDDVTPLFSSGLWAQVIIESITAMSMQYRRVLHKPAQILNACPESTSITTPGGVPRCMRTRSPSRRRVWSHYSVAVWPLCSRRPVHLRLCVASQLVSDMPQSPIQPVTTGYGGRSDVRFAPVGRCGPA